MSCGDIFCHHEWLKTHKNHHGLDTHKYTGNSDCAIPFFGQPDGPLVIIERDIDEVANSLKRINLFNDDVYHGLINGKRLMVLLNGLKIKYHDINYSLRDIWEYLVDVPYDPVRGEQLKNMYIQSSLYMANERIA